MKQGDVAWIIENNRTIRECTIVRINGKFAIIRFSNGGGIQVSINRLYETEEMAQKAISKYGNESHISSQCERLNSQKYNAQML